MDVKMIHIDETDSTNRWLREQGGEDDLVVVADYQTAGRGCGTNTWESERGKNLLFSVLCHPMQVPANRQFAISQAIALALSETLADYVDGVSVKWPNDIYVGDQKIGGILIENKLQGTRIKECIIGVGLNVNQKRFMSDAPNPVSLCQLLGHEVDRTTLLDAILQRLSENLNHFDELDADYRKGLYRKEGYHPYRDHDGIFEAELVTVEGDGRLILKGRDGQLRAYAFKEVQYIIPETTIHLK